MEGYSLVPAMRSRLRLAFSMALAVAGPEDTNLYLALFHIREGLCEVFDTGGGGEDQHVVVEVLDLFLRERIAERTVHHAFGMVKVLGVQQVLDVVVVDTAQWHQILFGLMLDHDRQQIVDLAGGAEEYLSLAVLHVFLNVKGNSLRDAEVLHVLRNDETKLFSQLKEIVNGVA